MASNSFTHFTGKKRPFQTQKRKKKPKRKRIHKNKYENRRRERVNIFGILLKDGYRCALKAFALHAVDFGKSAKMSIESVLEVGRMVA